MSINVLPSRHAQAVTKLTRCAHTSCGQVLPELPSIHRAQQKLATLKPLL